MFKTGSLTGVKAIAGFLRDAAGREMAALSVLLIKVTVFVFGRFKMP